MVDSGTAGAAGSASDAALAARDFRVSLEHRRDIDGLVAEAVAVRQRATVEAAEVVRNAEALAREIVADARKEAARLTAEAQHELETASARRNLADAVRAEQVSATIDRLESIASDVQMIFDSALTEVAASLGTPVDHQRHAPARPDPGSESHRSDTESSSESAGSTDEARVHQFRDAAEQRLERWRERFRQAR